MNSREKMLVGMHEVVMHLNNESLHEEWLRLAVPDCANEDYICGMANDDEDFSYCVSLFMDIMHRESAYNDGIVIDGLPLINFESR